MRSKNMKKHINTSVIVSTVIAIVALTLMFVYAAEPKILIWQFNEGAGKIAREYKKTTIDAKFNEEGKGISWENGKYGKALEFTGTDADPQWLVVPHSDETDIRDAITMQAWIFLKNIRGDKRTIITKASYYLQIEPTGQVAAYFYDVVPPGYHRSKETVRENEWNHIAVTYDGRKIKFYINGVEDENVFNASGQIRHRPDWDLHVGGEAAKPHCCQRYFQGIIDELVIANYAMSAHEIRQVMEGNYSDFEFR